MQILYSSLFFLISCFLVLFLADDENEDIFLQIQEDQKTI